MLRVALSVFAFLVFFQQSADAAAQDKCSASGGLTFVCGLTNAEDLVSIPDTAGSCRVAWHLGAEST